jgi:hypothetical protein
MDTGLIFVPPFGEYKLQANSRCCDGYIFPHTAKSVWSFALQVKSSCEKKKRHKKRIFPFFVIFKILYHKICLKFFDFVNSYL